MFRSGSSPSVLQRDAGKGSFGRGHARHFGHGGGNSPVHDRLTAVSSAASGVGGDDRSSCGSSDCVRVFLRVRPPTEPERAKHERATPTVLALDRQAGSVILGGARPGSFTFDGVIGEESNQDEVFELVGRSVSCSCLAGYNGSAYVYGQTGAGKTYTMFGPVSSVHGMQCDPQRGLSCRILEFVFDELQRRYQEAVDEEARAVESGDSPRAASSYVCRCSFLEIYKEQITDLLEPCNTGLQLREDAQKGVRVEKLSEPVVLNLTEAFQVLWKGLQLRRTGATHMNERSSRSHAVFTLIVEITEQRGTVTAKRTARLSLVDLAGSERQQGLLDARTGSGLVTRGHEKMRVREAGAINKSLSALTNVIMSLSQEKKSSRKACPTGEDAGGRRAFVRYRDSKLTHLLRDSLGGNSKTVIVANVSPSPLCASETTSTLQFAARAKHIRCAAVQSEEVSGTVEDLVKEVKSLRQQVAELTAFRNAQASPCCARASDRSSRSCSTNSPGSGSRASNDPEDATPRESQPSLSELARKSSSASIGLHGRASKAPFSKEANEERGLDTRLETARRKLLQKVAELRNIEAKLDGSDSKADVASKDDETATNYEAESSPTAKCSGKPGRSSSLPSGSRVVKKSDRNEEQERCNFRAALGDLPDWVMADVLGANQGVTDDGSVLAQNGLGRQLSAASLRRASAADEGGETRRVQLSNGEYFYWQSGAAAGDDGTLQAFGAPGHSRSARAASFTEQSKIATGVIVPPTSPTSHHPCLFPLSPVVAGVMGGVPLSPMGAPQPPVSPSGIRRSPSSPTSFIRQHAPESPTAHGATQQGARNATVAWPHAKQAHSPPPRTPVIPAFAGAGLSSILKPGCDVSSRDAFFRSSPCSSREVSESPAKARHESANLAASAW